MCCSIISTKCCRRAAFQITYQVRSDKVRSSTVTVEFRGAFKGAYRGGKRRRIGGVMETIIITRGSRGGAGGNEWAVSI